MLSKSSSLLAFFMAIGMCGLSFAATEKLVFDPMHTDVQFKVRHMMINNVKGSLGTPKGHFTVDDADLAKSKVSASVDVSTINTGNEMRDKHLKSADFFNVTKFPTITFESTKFESEGEGKYKMLGKLTLHGVTKEVTWNVDNFSKPVKDPMGTPRRGFSATTKINRGDYGLKYNKALEAGGVMIGDEVEVAIDTELVPETKAKN
jgi:polyisoprenoid-binding protein YceI